jgi:hypothetical protein
LQDDPSGAWIYLHGVIWRMELGGLLSRN